MHNFGNLVKAENVVLKGFSCKVVRVEIYGHLGQESCSYVSQLEWLSRATVSHTFLLTEVINYAFKLTSFLKLLILIRFLGKIHYICTYIHTYIHTHIPV